MAGIPKGKVWVHGSPEGTFHKSGPSCGSNTCCGQEGPARGLVACLVMVTYADITELLPCLTFPTTL